MSSPERSEGAWTYSRRMGGLMRCCLASLDDAMVERVANGEPAPSEGHIVGCRYCSSRMVLRNGVFEWDREHAEKAANSV